MGGGRSSCGLLWRALLRRALVNEQLRLHRNKISPQLTRGFEWGKQRIRASRGQGSKGRRKGRPQADAQVAMSAPRWSRALRANSTPHGCRFQALRPKGGRDPNAGLLTGGDAPLPRGGQSPNLLFQPGPQVPSCWWWRGAEEGENGVQREAFQGSGLSEQHHTTSPASPQIAQVTGRRRPQDCPAATQSRAPCPRDTFKLSGRTASHGPGQPPASSTRNRTHAERHPNLE